MGIQIDESGRRSVEAYVLVGGSPAEIWAAVATGSGISSWFVPTTFVPPEGGAGAKVLSSFGPGMDSESTVTLWEPNRRFTAESHDLGETAPVVSTDWTVEPRSGGRSLVRVRHSVISATDQWDKSLESWEAGWPAFLRILQLYLENFSGQPHAAMALMGTAPGPEAAAWEAAIKALGLEEVRAGEWRDAPDDVPPFGGCVQRTEEGNQRLLLLDKPAPGIAHLASHPMGGKIYLSLRIILFGDDAAATVAREEPLWQAWMKARFAL